MAPSEPARASERAHQPWEPLRALPHASERTPAASEKEAVDPELRVEPQPSLDNLSVATSSTPANLEELHLDWSLPPEVWEFLEQQPCSPSDFGISDADMD